MEKETARKERNKVLVKGNLVRDADLRFTQKGTALCMFRIAISNDYKSKDTGEWVKTEATFIDIKAWRQLAETCGRRLKKGDPVYVDGRLQSRNWEDKQGNKRTTIEIVAWQVEFLERKTPKTSESAAAPSTPSQDEAMDEVPF